MDEIDSLPGRHLFFLDDNLFGNPRFASSLFSGMQGMGRLWQAAATVDAVLRPNLLEQAVASGLRSLFVGFESLTPGNLAAQGKRQNLGRDYAQAVRRLHDLGVMVNGSFVFGMDEDDATVFDRTVEWAVSQGIETATFHILTPYPGTTLYQRMSAAGRMTTSNWNLYDTRHTVFHPARMTGEQLEAGYWRAYQQILQLAIDPALVLHSRRPDRTASPSCVRRRLEEVRTAMGYGHSGKTVDQLHASAGISSGLV